MKEEARILECIGIPLKTRSVVLEHNLPAQVDVAELHRSLFLHGPAGSGKTVQAASILTASLYTKIHIPSILRILDPGSDMYMGDRTPQFASRYVFTRIPAMLQRFKKSFERNAKETEGDLIDFYSQARLLVLDDLGAEMSTDWAYLTLYLIVDNRYNDMLPTIFTSNLDPWKLAEKRFADERLLSRILEMCKEGGIREIGGTDYRHPC